MKRNYLESPLVQTNVRLVIIIEQYNCSENKIITILSSVNVFKCGIEIEITMISPGIFIHIVFPNIHWRITNSLFNI